MDRELDLNFKKEGRMRRLPSQSHQTQYVKELPIFLRRTSCGIASLYTALKYLGYENGEFVDFLVKYISFGKYNVPTYYTNTKVNGYTLNVPITYLPQEGEGDYGKYKQLFNSLDNTKLVELNREYNPNNPFIPTYTAIHGFDHRGINPFLKDNNILLKAELFETNDLPDSLGNNSAILASVDMSQLGYPLYAKLPTEHISTHVITIFRIEKLGDTNVALFSDPAFLNSTEGGVQVRSLDTIRDCTSHFTIISSEE